MNGKDGDTAITGDAGATSIRVSGVKRVLSESVRVAQAHLHKLQVRSGGLNTRALVETRQPACSLGREDIVDYPITQPVFLRLRTNNLDGVITVEAENNGITDNNLAGNVTLTDVAGSAAVNLLSGDNSARIPILPLSGGINLIVLNGNIYLVIPAATSAVFLAEVSSGKSIPRPWCC